jgi:membrane protease YdiL (CAAX protease family)
MVVFWAIAYAIGIGGYTASRLYPNDLWILVIWGIGLGGALITLAVDGRAGLRSLLSRIVRWRVGIQWYLVALLAPVVLEFIANELCLLTGVQPTGSLQLSALGDFAGIFVFSLLTISLGEEVGFRGFALPRYLQGRTAVAASLILGVLHAIWHLPLVIGGDELWPILIDPLAAAFLFTWIFNHTDGSVLLALILHASSDAAGAFSAPMFSGAAAMPHRLWLAAAFVVMVLVLRALAGPELGRKPTGEMDMIRPGPAMAAD